MSARPIHHVLAAVLSLAFIFATTNAHAQKGSSGLPIPRFVSLAAKEVNLRAGPGKNYPVTWVFVRKGLPVMVTAEFEYWRKVRDLDGAEGWVHKNLLSNRRAAVVTDDLATLRRAPEVEAAPVLRAEQGVVGRLLACQQQWCQLEIADREGWLAREQIFGALPDETFD